MSKITKYFLQTTGVNFADFDLGYAEVNLNAAEIYYKGSNAVDRVFVGSGMTFDFTQSLGGTDKIYLNGARSSYVASYDVDSEVLTLTRSSDNTIVRVGPADRVVFTDGWASTDALIANVQDAVNNPVTLATDELSATSKESLSAGSTALNNVLKAFGSGTEGATFGQVRSGVQLVAKGTNFVDSVYVTAGTSVDASQLLGGNDKIYLTGNYADYTTKTWDADNEQLTLERTVGANTERVVFVGGDTVYFADGNTSTQAIIDSIVNSTASPTLIAPTTPGLSDIDTIAITSNPGVDNTYVTGDTIEFTVTMKAGKNVDVSGAPVLTFMMGTTPVTATLLSTGTNLNTFKFTHVVQPGQVDANGISWAANAISGSGISFPNSSDLPRLSLTPQSNVAAAKVDGTPAGAPSLSITDNVSTIANGPVVFTFKFSEDVTGFDASKIAVTGGQAGAFNAVNASTYTLVVTPNANSTTPIGVTVGTSGASDIFGNALASAVSASQAVDTTAPMAADTSAPTLVITDNIAGTANGPVIFTFNFSEDVMGFDASKVALTGGTAGAFNAVNGRTYTLLVTPNTNSTTPIGVTVAAGAAADASGNGLRASVNVSQAVDTTSPAPADTTAPLLTITDNVTQAKVTGSVLYTFTFSEPVVGFDLNKVAITNGVAGALSQVNANTYTLEVTPTSNTTGNLSVSVAASTSLQDLHGNSLAAPVSSRNLAFDTTAIAWSVQAQQSEVSEAAGTAVFIVSRVGATAAASVVLTSGGGTATSGTDYTAVTQTVSFLEGEMSKLVSVAITNDTAIEPNETFSATLSAPSLGNIATPSASVTILDNDQSIWAVSAPTNVSEGAGTVTFTVTRTGATSAAASIVFDTLAGTASAGTDFSAVTAQTLNFDAGQTTKTVTVNLTDDALFEATESFVGRISNQSAGSIGTATAAVEIQDNEQSSWSVSAPAVVSEGAGVVVFTITRTGADAAATLNFSTSAGSAASPADFTANNQQISFAQGELSKTVSIAIEDDSVFEQNETFTGTISSASSGVVVTPSATVTIQDNEQAVWSIEALGSASEAAGQLIWRIVRTGDTSAATTATFAVTGGTATAGVDYVAPTATTLNFGADETSKIVSINITNDTAPELDESITLGLTQVGAGTVDSARSAATNWILEDDNMLWSISSVGTVQETAGTATWTISRSGALSAATVTYSVVGGTALQDTHFTVPGMVNGVGTLSFAEGEQSKTITAQITDNMTANGDKTIVMGVSSVSQGTLAGGSSSGVTIVDNEIVQWSVQSPNGAVIEGDGAQMVFYIRRSGDVSQSDTIWYQIGGGTAQSGVDYTAVSKTQLTFAAGEEVKAVTLNILNDSLGEAAKTISLGIIDPSRGTITSERGTGNLNDDDLTVWTIASNGDVVEGGLISFTVTRTGNVAGTGSVQYGFAGGSAVVDGDHAAFGSSTNTISFAAGEISKVITVQTNEDGTPEPDETVTVALFNPSTGTVVGTQGFNHGGQRATATIIDNDSTKWSISGQDSSESAGFMTYTIRRTGNVSGTETIDYAITGGSAVAGTNYVALPSGPQTLSFSAGEVSKIVTVQLLNDSVPDVNTTLTMSISNASSGVILDATRTSAIRDANQAMMWHIWGSGYFSEGTDTATWRVFREGDISSAASIRVKTANFQASAPGDFEAIDTVLQFAEGEASKTVSVKILEDGITENQAEHFTINLSEASAGTIVSGFSYGPIIDANQSFWDVGRVGTTVSEGSGGVVFEVLRQGATPGGTTVEYRVVDSANGNAQIVDWTTLTYATGESHKAVYVPLIDDSNAQTTLPKYQVELRNWSSGTYNANSWITNSNVNWNTTISDNDQVFLNVYGSNSDTQEFRNVITESSAGAANSAVFRVVRTGNTDVQTTFDFSIDTANEIAGTYLNTMAASSTRAVTAIASVDYVPLTVNQLTFAPGETVKLISVQLINDNTPESGKLIRMNISNGVSTGSVITTLQQTTIRNYVIDDDWDYATGNNDVITNYGGTANRVIDLGAGDDTLNLAADSDGGSLYQAGNGGSGGSDELDASALTAPVLAWNLIVPGDGGTGFDGTITYGSNPSTDPKDEFWNFETFRLGAGNHSLTKAANKAATVHARAHHTVNLGDSTVTGNDTVFITRDTSGSAAAGTYATTGAGVFAGGGGTDTLSFANVTDELRVVFSNSSMQGTFVGATQTGLAGSFTGFENFTYGGKVNITLAASTALGSWFSFSAGVADDVINLSNAASGTAVYNDLGTGGSGGDQVTLTSLSDYVIAGSEAVAGNDNFVLGAGYDRLTYEEALATTSLNVQISSFVSGQGYSGTVQATQIGTDSFSGVEVISGGKGNDTFTTSITANTGNGIDLDGRGGDDVFNLNSLTSGVVYIYERTSQGSGADTYSATGGARLLAYGGNETVVGNDSYTAGADLYDAIDYSNATSGLTLTLTGNSTIGPRGAAGTISGTSVGTDTFDGFEKFVLSGFADTVIANSAFSRNNFAGMEYQLGAGNDVFQSAMGSDFVILGTGIDTVRYIKFGDTAKGGHTGDDLIRGFKHTEDKFSFSTDFFTGSVTSANVTSFIRMNGTTNELQVDRDGSGSAYGWALMAYLDQPDGALPVTADIQTMFDNSRIVIA